MEASSFDSSAERLYVTIAMVADAGSKAVSVDEDSVASGLCGMAVSSYRPDSFSLSGA